jgi:hypothetical protein
LITWTRSGIGSERGRRREVTAVTAPDGHSHDTTVTSEARAVMGPLADLMAAHGTARDAAAQAAVVASPQARQVVAAMTNAQIPPDVAAAVLKMTLAVSPVPRTSRIQLAADPPPTTTRRRTQLFNLARRAAYLITAGRRVAANVLRAPLLDPNTLDDPAAASPGTFDPGSDADEQATITGRLVALRDALGGELPNWLSHVAAARRRDDAASAVDAAAHEHGDLLGWQTVLDERTTPECRAANGLNFYADDPPAIGAPGTVHGFCRCVAVGPFDGAGLVGGGPDDTPVDVTGLQEVGLADDSMTKASTPQPVGAHELWHRRGGHLPFYIEHVANQLIADGHDESEAIAMAVGIIRNWASGRPSGAEKRVKPSTVAAARKALAEWEAMKGHQHTGPPAPALELADTTNPAAAAGTVPVRSALDGPRMTRAVAVAALRRLRPADRRRVITRVLAARRAHQREHR